MLRKTWKGLVAGVAAVAAVAVGSGTAQAAQCGDLNDSGSRNVSDVVLLFRAVLENPDPTPLCGGAGALDCGDINDDNAISVNDVVILFSSVLGNETLFALCSGPGATIACPGGTATISSAITTNQTWPSSCTILLDGTIFVEPNVVLTIQAGTTIKGKKNPTNPPPSALVFRRDSKINANGSAASPIIFTSDQAPGARLAGDWGGLAINGRSTINCPGGECLAEGLTAVPFGGNEPNDSSGILKYVRVEFAGRILSTDNELNVVTLNGVGRGTAMDHVQANVGLDDGIEWFGGTVNGKYLVSTGAADDQLDWQLGTQSSSQYVYASQLGANLDSAGSHGFEGDNNENGFDFSPRSAPKFCNVTVIGCKGQGGNCTVDSSGALLRRGTSGQIWNSIITNFGNRGVQMRDAATANNACNAGPTLTGNLILKSTLFYDNGSGAPGTTHCANHSSTASGSNCQTCDIYALWKAQAGNDAVVDGTNPGLGGSTYPAGRVPTAGATNGVNCNTGLDSFFDATSYRGSHDPGGADWMTTPWISQAIN